MIAKALSSGRTVHTMGGTIAWYGWETGWQRGPCPDTRTPETCDFLTNCKDGDFSKAEILYHGGVGKTISGYAERHATLGKGSKRSRDRSIPGEDAERG